MMKAVRAIGGIAMLVLLIATGGIPASGQTRAQADQGRNHAPVKRCAVFCSSGAGGVMPGPCDIEYCLAVCGTQVCDLMGL
jgi:hypothetical protein